jgi:hypothetical protein
MREVAFSADELIYYFPNAEGMFTSVKIPPGCKTTPTAVGLAE